MTIDPHNPFLNSNLPRTGLMASIPFLIVSKGIFSAIAEAMAASAFFKLCSPSNLTLISIWPFGV